MMDANGGNMDRRLQKEIHALELIIVALLLLPVQLENRYKLTNVYKFMIILSLS